MSLRPAIALAVCLALLAACASPASNRKTGTSPGAPPWVEDAYVGTNRAAVMAAVGSAPGIGRDAEDAARRSAMRRINEDILSSVRSELTTLSAQFASSTDGERWQQDMMEHILIESEGDLPGAKISDRWVDAGRNEICVRVTVDRELLVKLLLDPVEESQLKAQGLLDGLKQTSTNAAQELVITLKAYDLVARTFTDAMRATSAARSGGRSGMGTPTAAHAQQVYGKSRAILDQLSAQVARTAPRIHVLKMQGDGQRGDPWEPLAESLVGRVTFDVDGDTVPMAEFPMRYRAQVSDGARTPTLVHGSATTDADGHIRCDVTELVADRQGSGQIVLEVDVESLGPSLLSDTLPSATFVYAVRTAGQTAVAVDIETRYDGQLLERPDLTTVIAGHLSSAGFQASGRPGLTGLDVQAVAGALADDARYAVRGDVTASYSSRDGDYYWYVARARLEIVHVPTGRVVQTLTREARKPWSERTNAGASAVVIALQNDLLAVLDQEFVSGFAP
jgi:hypothetical protein